jgi:hypothetical protein
LKDVIENQIIGKAITNGDRYLASMGFTLMKEKEKALFATIVCYGLLDILDILITVQLDATCLDLLTYRSIRQ